MTTHQLCAVLDFGSQYTQLIARRVREQGVYCRILPHDVRADELRSMAPRALILSGGPASVYDQGAPALDPALLDLGCPVLGICYGLQLVGRLLGAPVARARTREYGRASLALLPAAGSDPLLRGLSGGSQVWMSHGDAVQPGGGLEALARTDDCALAAVRLPGKPFWGLQFHPEVTHTEGGALVLRNFLYGIGGFGGDWRLGDVVRSSVEAVRARVGRDSVLVALSGGVDSSVVAALCREAVGPRAHAVFVDNGLLRAGERAEVEAAFAGTDLDLRTVDAADRFLDALDAVADPEEKRKRIGHTFIDVFRDEARKLQGVRFLAQGTLYPDVIESKPPAGGPSVTIKSHHNVGGLPADLGFELVEPLREFFKDEARTLGRLLGLPESLVGRHPFPGPGLAVRVMGPVTRSRLEVLRAADRIVLQELRAAGLYDRTFQAFAVLLPSMSVGVMGDGRTSAHVVAVRCVDSTDAMTADWTRLPHELLARMSTRITNEVPSVNRVVYDVTSKPPATIEWE